MKYLSLFSGIGGFELGLENADKEFECIGFSEIDNDEVDSGDGIRLCHPTSTTARGRTEKEQTGALSTGPDWGTVERDYRIRRLTPRECERLQAFPDDWTLYGKDGEKISDTQRYKCIGNAVTTTVVTYIANTMFGGSFESKGTD